MILSSSRIRVAYYQIFIEFIYSMMNIFAPKKPCTVNIFAETRGLLWKSNYFSFLEYACTERTGLSLNTKSR